MMRFDRRTCRARLATRALVAGAAAGALGLLPAHSARADEGMWPFNLVPKALIQKKYGFEISDAWLEHVQKSSVRLGAGGSGSIGSANGLVMTNHHVGRDIVETLSTAEKNMLETGFLAASPAEELKAPDLELLSLWGIEDVSERVLAAGAGKAAAEADAARRAAMAARRARR